MTNRPLAIGARLKQFEQINTIGLKPNFSDYPQHIQKQIKAAKKIFYPTAFYADLFNAMGKQTFPSFHTYKFAVDKIKQSAAFQMSDIPHPQTRVFYGENQKTEILNSFDFPFIAKIPRGSAKGCGVFLIRTPEDLAQFLVIKGPAYIQEYLPIDRDMRIIIIGKKIRLAYWRIAAENNFKTNISQGGAISFDPLPQKALDLALVTAQKCQWDDVGIDIIEHENKFYVLEGNMKYGTKGFKAAGIDYKKLLLDLVLNEEI
ncbi:MAG: ATP-grasp domain-containing protein [Proteobacteria bacterium]|nr:ATP-grasp domain-containing protein [Pseudomonadota bacterium]MBU1389649.1 ATP-grasp domain-containing protein [Pseudomonadota bacterium]MBU1542587.1 ATP-grasp domain-containing protein [Pseudomonadota bacterium]MBU2483046.1 ATP-grasp domain-containing protein [Pseudomonadota bacterium]